MTTDNQTPDPTPALLSAERLAEIRAADAADTWPVASTVGGHDRRALLAHLDALTGPLPADGGEAPVPAKLYSDLMWTTPCDDPRDRSRQVAEEMYRQGRAAGRSEGEALRHQAYAQVDAYAIERDEARAEIARLTEELATIADRMKRTEGAQAQLDRALASCETYRAEIERLTAERDTAHDEYIEATERADIEEARVGNLAAELVEARAQRDYLKRREEDIIAACERVADGGQYRADIVSAIQSLRRDRDAARLSGAREEREAMASHVKAMRDGSALHAPTLNTLVHWLRARDEGGRR